HRQLSADEHAFVSARGTLARSATMRVMARTDDGAALVELKAVDGAYPLYGSLALDPDAPLADLLAEKDGVFGAAADPALRPRLSRRVGSRLHVGRAAVEIRAVSAREPDKLAGGIGFGPRLLVGLDLLDVSALVQPGSLVRWHYKLRLPPAAATDRA